HARWPLVVLRVGRGLAAGGTVFETSYGLGLAQLGQQALEASCADLERWQAPELAWLGERLHALPPAAEGVPRFDGALSAEQQAAGAQQLAATRERAESGLRALRTRIDDALRQRAGGVK
ncbi:MAG: hypothetical protein KDD82_17375, partial [Planctomycetes bacterium]|nr:hypothetical protein [Planctomycetota bacterium]